MGVDPTIRTPPDSAGRKFYLAYLNSASWRITRNHALRRAGFQCERCGSKRELQVHHRCYDRLGREWDGDLEVLCDLCHGGHHEIIKAREGTNPRLYLKIVSQVLLGLKVIETFSDIAEAAKTECARLKIPYDSAAIGHAIELIQSKHKTPARTQVTATPAADSRPLDKGEAARILAQLLDGDETPVLRVMPGRSLEDRHAHHLRVLEQSKVVQHEEYQREARSQSITDRLKAIFSEPLR